MQGRRSQTFPQYVCFWLIASAPLAAAAVDWTQWRGPQRDGSIPSSSSAVHNWPEKLKRVWEVTVGEGHSSPVIEGTRVFQFARQADREVIAAYDLATGKKLWEYGYAAPYEMNPAARGHGKGPKSTPVVGGGRVCTLGITGTLTCLDAATGKMAWSKPNLGDAVFGTAASPAIDNGTLIAQTGRGDSGAITAWTLASGKELWSVKTEGAAYSSPVIADIGGVRQVVVETEANIVGVDASSGTLLWKVPIASPYEQNSVTPIVHGGTVIYSALANPVTALRPVKKGAQWTADKIWENKEVGMYMNSPVVSGGLLYGLSHRNKGQFFALDPATGKTVWTGEGRQAENAAMIAHGATVLAVTTNAELLVMRASPKGLEELRRYTVADSPVWAHPAIAGSKILVKDRDSLALWSAE